MHITPYADSMARQHADAIYTSTQNYTQIVCTHNYIFIHMSRYVDVFIYIQGQCKFIVACKMAVDQA